MKLWTIKTLTKLGYIKWKRRVYIECLITDGGLKYRTFWRGLEFRVNNFSMNLEPHIIIVTIYAMFC